jgi:hypothetical protein
VKMPSSSTSTYSVRATCRCTTSRASAVGSNARNSAIASGAASPGCPLEEIDVGRIQRRMARDVRRFAVAGGRGCKWKHAGDCGRHQAVFAELHDLSPGSCERQVDKRRWGIRRMRGADARTTHLAAIFFIHASSGLEAA